MLKLTKSKLKYFTPLHVNKLFEEYSKTGSKELYDEILVKIYEWIIPRIRKIARRTGYRDLEEIESYIIIPIMRNLDISVSMVYNYDLESFMIFRLRKAIMDFIRNDSRVRNKLKRQKLDYTTLLIYDDNDEGIDLNNIYRKLNYEEGQYIKLKLEGKKDNEIAEFLGYSRSNISRIRKKILWKLGPINTIKEIDNVK